MLAALRSGVRLGWYRPVHVKSASAQEVRSLLTARKLIAGKLLDIESGIRGVLSGFGLKVGAISRGRFEARIRDLVEGHTMLETVIGSMLAARAAPRVEFTRLHRALLALVRADPVCRQLMRVPGVGAVELSPSRAGSTIQHASAHREMSDLTSGSLLRKYQSGRWTSPARSAR
jgi:transposase